MEKTFILENITPPDFRDGKEIKPPGYINNISFLYGIIKRLKIKIE